MNVRLDGLCLRPLSLRKTVARRADQRTSGETRALSGREPLTLHGPYLRREEAEAGMAAI